MTPSDLKIHVENTGSYFFTRETMSFFGDTMSNYRVRSATVIDHFNKKVECWELWRKRPVKYGECSSAYFDKQTFERVLPKPD